jgi:ATP-binding cassette subfamily B protein
MERDSHPTTGLRILGLFRPYRWRLVAMAGLIILTVGLNVPGPLMLRTVINQALPDRDTRLLVLLCSLMVVIGVVTSLVSIAQDAVVHRITQSLVHRLRIDLFDRMQAMPLEFFSGESNSSIQARLASDIGGISDTAGFALRGTLTSAVSLIATGTVMVLLSWPLAVVSVVLASVLNLVNLRFNDRRRQFADDRQAAVGDMLKLVGEDLALPGVILGRTFGTHRLRRGRFEEVSATISSLSYRQRMAGSSTRALIIATLAALPPLIFLLAGTAFPGLSLGTVIVLATMQAKLTAPIQYLLGLGGTVQSIKAMFGRVFEFLDLEPGISLPAEPSPPCAQRPARLALRGLEFSYRAANGRGSLSDVTVAFEAGSTTLVVGSTGAGKSTLALALAGLVEPTAGVIELDGCPAGPQELWRAVTLVSQDAAVFNDTIRANLLLAKPEATQAELEGVLALVELTDKVAGLADGLDTTVGERGYQLSGGERQRLALARALLAPSPILVVDEATSALDGVTAAHLHAAVREHCHGRTLITIAHRIPAMRPADSVIAMADGRIEEHGRHRELADAGGVYSRLLRAQAIVAGDPAADVTSRTPPTRHEMAGAL